MSRQLSTLREEHTFEYHHLSLNQFVRAEAGVIAAALSLAVFFCALPTPWLVPIAMLAFLASLATCFVDATWPLRARMQVNGSKLTVVAGLGRFPFRRTVNLEVRGLEVWVEGGPVVFGMQTWTLLLRSGRQVVCLRHLISTESEMTAICDVLRHHARRPLGEPFLRLVYSAR